LLFCKLAFSAGPDYSAMVVSVNVSGPGLLCD
jgi:hypothetical protein